jgi:hypothetical protein
LRPSEVGGCENPKWAWWLGGAFVHEVGIGSVIFVVGVSGAPEFLAGMVGGGEECLWHWTKQSCPGVNGERNKDHVFFGRVRR